MTATRVQLALNVDDIEAATRFYTKLFDVGPHKQGSGYANFIVDGADQSAGSPACCAGSAAAGHGCCP